LRKGRKEKGDEENGKCDRRYGAQIGKVSKNREIVFGTMKQATEEERE